VLAASPGDGIRRENRIMAATSTSLQARLRPSVVDRLARGTTAHSQRSLVVTSNPHAQQTPHLCAYSPL